MAKRYALGIDFGTESGRTLIVDVETGEEIASSVYAYPDGVIDDILPDGKTKLPHDFALQNPADYIGVLRETIPAVLRESGVKPEDVIGIGIDFTACTMLPVDKGGEPLCFHESFRNNPHSWVKLWKHHHAQPEADDINRIAKERGEAFLNLYGGKISSEWMFPKILETLRSAPEVYDAADRIMEAADWVIMKMTGKECRNACTAGYKAMWEKGKGYPSKEYFRAVHPKLGNVVEEKLSTDIYPIGAKAGELTEEIAKLTGLRAGTAVAVANVDAHVAVPAATVTDIGKMVMIMGTSICHMVCGKEKQIVDGMCGVVEDGILGGLFGFEAGQSGGGDHFAWFTENCVSASLEDEAKNKKKSIHELLEEKAAALVPGESGLVALDWWNGNRSVLVDVDLTGMLLGMTLATKPEEIYRALIEAIAFGTRKIIQAFEDRGVAIKELYACGGLPDKNKLLMQIFSDVTNREIRIAKSGQASALGSAMFGAVAAGKARGGYDSIVDAAKKMAHLRDEVYRPDNARVKVYDKLYGEYDQLYEYFGRKGNDVMKRLKKMKAGARG